MAMRNITRQRLLCGLTAIVLVILFNPWTARLISADGHLETRSTLVVLGFDVLFVGIGLLILFASRSVIIGLSVSVVAGLIALGVVDLAARVFLTSALYYRPEDIYKNRLPELPSHSLFERNVSYTGQTSGDLAAMTTLDSLREVREVNFRTDAYGYRNDPWDSTKPLDLIILGDSFGSGVGTTQEEMWDAYLRSNYGLNTYNLSIPGYSPWHELLTLKREMPRLRVGTNTTVLWAIFDGNDLDEPCPTILSLPPPNGSWNRLKVSLSTFYRRSPIRQFARRALRGLLDEPRPDSCIIATLPDKRVFLMSALYLERENRTLDDVRQHPNLPGMRAVFPEIGAFSRSYGLGVLVAYIPSKGGVYTWLLDRTCPLVGPRGDSQTALSHVLEELCRENGFGFIDLEPVMRRESQRIYEESGELLWWRDDTHWNGKGHMVAAQAISDWLCDHQVRTH